MGPDEDTDSDYIMTDMAMNKLDFSSPDIAIKTVNCFCCFTTKQLKKFRAHSSDERKICVPCANLVCEGCETLDDIFLQYSHGDQTTLCIDCLDKVCRKCKQMENIAIKHSTHGRTLCQNCKYSGETAMKAGMRRGEDLQPIVND